MYREPDYSSAVEQVDQLTHQLDLMKRERDEMQRAVWSARRAPRLRQALNLGGIVGSIGALFGDLLALAFDRVGFAFLGLVIGAGLGVILALQDKIEPRPQDAPPERKFY